MQDSAEEKNPSSASCKDIMSKMLTKTSQALQTSRRLRVYLLGPTGSGKSTAINSLFQKECAQEASGLGKSTTKFVTHYSYSQDKDLNFTLYDTPGFPDTEPEHIKVCFDRLIESEVDGGKTGMNVTGVDAAIFIVKTESIGNDFWHDLSLLTDELGRLSPDVHRFLLVNVVAGKKIADGVKCKNGKTCADKVNKILNWCDESNIIISTGFGGENLGLDIKTALSKVTGSSTKQNLQTMDQILQRYKDAFVSKETALKSVEDENRRDIATLETKIVELQEFLEWVPGEIQRLAIGAGLTAAAGVAAAPFSGGLSLTVLAGAGATEIGRQARMAQQESKLNELRTTKELLKCAQLRVKQSHDEALAQARAQGQKLRRLTNFIKDSYVFPEWMNFQGSRAI